MYISLKGQCHYKRLSYDSELSLFVGFGMCYFFLIMLKRESLYSANHSEKAMLTNFSMLD